MQDPAYLLYKSQLQTLLRKPEVVSLLGVSQTYSEQREIVHLNPAPPIERSRNIDSLVNRAEIGKEAGKGVREQVRSLEDRLRRRREKHGGMKESDKGGGSCFELELEKALEQCLEERSCEESVLISNYENRLLALQLDPKTTPSQIESLQQAHQQSLSSLHSLYSHRKREAVQTLKERYQLH